MVKMQGTEDEGTGSVLKYMTKPESDSHAADCPLWHSALLRLSRCGFALDEFTDKMRFLPGKGFVYRLAMDATRQGDDVAG